MHCREFSEQFLVLVIHGQLIRRISDSFREYIDGKKAVELGSYNYLSAQCLAQSVDVPLVQPIHVIHKNNLPNPIQSSVSE